MILVLIKKELFKDEEQHDIGGEIGEEE